jgi:uncharacterized protein (DUF924 family)
MRDIKQEILHFWFEETPPALWFQKNEEFDQQIRDRFLSAPEAKEFGLVDKIVESRKDLEASEKMNP